MKNILKFIFGFILITLTIFIYAKYIGIKGLIVKEYRVESDILTSNFSGIKIVHISDLFYNSTTDKEMLNKLVKEVNELKPDIIVFTGDLSLKKQLADREVELLKTTLLSLECTIGKYAIKGDNDYSLLDYDTIMVESDFNVLNNSYDKIYYNDNNYIYIVGFPSLIKDTIDIEKTFEFYNDENRKYTIVLVHEGNIINKLNESVYEVDLILGGHSLNGSIVIPYYGSLFIPKESSNYYAPYYKKGITNIFISSGIGTNEYPYRLLNKPSINLYRLKSNQ